MGVGRFITIEGIEGSGKSTQLELLAVYLRTQGRAVVTTREPGGTRLGERVRELLLHPQSDPVPLAELFLLEAARTQLVQQVIAPALAVGGVVLADRFADSSLAYQGVARRLGWKTVSRLNEIACAGLAPDATVVLDLPVEVALARARRRVSTTEENSRFEDEALAFHRRVAEGYLQLAQRAPERVLLVDATGAPEAVHQRVLGRLAGFLP
ncbi:MAG: dTMP kinase [Acidobacteriota bacterium]